jgi:hypothetical protein
MAHYQLKVMLNTSIPDVEGYVELTSELMNYEVPSGKVPMILSKYPFFDPQANYPRKEIQEMEYHKRIEVFFNQEKFKSVVLQFSSENKKDQDYVEPHEIEVDIDNKTKKEQADALEKEAKKQHRHKNFEFTIQTLLCTGFPVNNYFQSMEFYDSKIRTKKFTLKGSSWFPFLTGRRFSTMFSHLKMKGGMYTITGVVWVNDALNHPQYMAALDSFDEYTDEKKPEVNKEMREKVLKKRDFDINMFLLNMYKENLNNAVSIWKSKNMDEKKTRLEGANVKSDEQNSLNIQIDFQTDVLDNLNYAPEYKDKFSDQYVEVIDPSGALTGEKLYYNTLDKDKMDKDKMDKSTLVNSANYENIFLYRGKIHKVDEVYVSEQNQNEIDTINEQRNFNNHVYTYVRFIEQNILKSSPQVDDLKSLMGKDAAKGFFLSSRTAPRPQGKYYKKTKESPIELYTNLYNRYSQKQEFELTEEMERKIEEFLDNFEALKQAFIKEKNNDKSRAIYWFYSKLLENKDTIDKTVPEHEMTNKYSIIKQMMGRFLGPDSKNKEVKDKLETFLQKYTDDQFKNLRDTTYASELRKFINKIRKHDIELRAYDYVSTNADFSEDADKNEIQKVIREKFKNFQVYSNALQKLASTRVISNPYWKIEGDKFIGTEKGKIRAKKKSGENDDDDDDNLFEVLSVCRDINSKCKKKKTPKAMKYLTIGLDELKFGSSSNEKDTGSAKSSGFQTDNVYEAYIQANVIKGKITETNYSKLKCSYLNFSLGAMYKRMKKKTKENFIVKSKVYFDLEDQIAKANEKVSKESNLLKGVIAPPTDEKKNNEPKKEEVKQEDKKDTRSNKPDNKGGRKTRRRRKRRQNKKRRSIHKSRKKRFLKVNKTRKIYSS